jgi:FkbH-like protein
MAYSLIDLPWLLPAPTDFAAQCRAVAGTASAGHRLQQLAGHKLTSREAVAFGRALDKCRTADADLQPLSGFRLGVLSNATFDFIADEIPVAAARHGVAVEIALADFDQVIQAAMDPQSTVNRARPDAVLLAVDHRWFRFDGGAESPAEILEQGLQRLFAAAEAVRRNCGAAIIFQTLASPGPTLFGSFERRVPASILALINEANRRIIDHSSGGGHYLLDVAHLAARVGTDSWFDPTQWAAYKVPFSARCNAVYADHLGRLLGAIRGKSRKCLVLDLDNTIWGGVLGDDGVEGLTIGLGSAVGEAFLDVQRMALALRDRGVILAVASKNDHDIALKALEGHPELLIRPHHIAVLQANWVDKPSNLEAIAKTLSIGLDALVLLDDNPAERAQVRAALPAVAVPELPSDPAWYPWYLASAGYFEAVGFSAEDKQRADSYAANARRAEVQSSARDLGDYLTSLGMVLAVSEFDLAGRSRITQLINKTNQFNLTTRRYTEAEVAEVESRGDRIGLQARLSDRFGDLGMIGVIICHLEDSEEGPTARIDTWLMSCRVLGRKVEEAMFTALSAALRSKGVTDVSAEYRPTAKNHMVRDHFDRLGLTLLGEDADGVRRYGGSLATSTTFELPLKLELPSGLGA